MNAREYLEKHDLQLGESEEGHEYMLSDDSDLVDSFVNIIEEYHQQRSQEEAEVRYEKAKTILTHHNITFRTWDVTNRRHITQDTVLRIAAGKEEG